MLPLGPLQKSYDFLRKDPTWYLRKELVQGCGTVQLHVVVARLCTVLIILQARSKGLSMNQLGRKLEDKNLAYITRMTEAYFFQG
ncbi:hypothetical protein N7455_000337 [Penicillium solitum]|uniref:uncharacterized protein n=1 Tax=Penicillium solitum TaxID=60172 RepID=UPI0032C40C34|nr:hypothetical protein N7455_000337 [Penicillium solitum]